MGCLIKNRYRSDSQIYNPMPSSLFHCNVPFANQPGKMWYVTMVYTMDVLQTRGCTALYVLNDPDLMNRIERIQRIDPRLNEMNKFTMSDEYMNGTRGCTAWPLENRTRFSILPHYLQR